MSESTVRSFGAELRRRRLAANLSLEALAMRVYYSRGHLSKVENGLKRPAVLLARRCDVALQAGGALAALVGESVRAPMAQGVAAVADWSLNDPWLIVMSEHASCAVGVAASRDAQGGPRWLIEAARGPAWSDPAVLEAFRKIFEQLRALGQVARPADVVPGLIVHLRTIWSMAAAAQPLLRCELYVLAARFAEYIGWMAQEAGDAGQSVAWTDLATEMAGWGGEDLTAYRLIRLGDLSMYQGRWTQTIAQASQALRSARDPRVAGLAAQRLAQGHALAGDSSSCLGALEQSARLFAGSPATTAFTLGSTSVPDHAAMATGWCLLDLGQPREAADVLAAEVSRIPAGAHRARVRYGIRLARCYAECGEIDQACITAESFLPFLLSLDSATIRTDVNRLEATLRRYHQHPSVKSLMPSLANCRPGVPGRTLHLSALRARE